MKSERIEEIYGALDKMTVKLDPDPVSRGPQYMQDLVSLTRGYLNEVGVYIQEAHRERHRLEMAKEALETVFEARSDELLVEDKRVSNLPSIEDRRSMINLILKDERREIAEVNGKLKAISLVEKALRFRHKELDSTMSAIRVQRSLISMELGTGSVYGDESETSRGSLWGKKRSSSTEPVVPQEDESDLEDDLAKQMAELMNETPEKKEESEPEPTPEEAPEAAVEEAFEVEETPIPDPVPTPKAKPAPEPEDDNVSLGDDDDFSSFLDIPSQDVGQSEEELPEPTSQKKTESMRAVPEEDPDVETFLEEDEFRDFLESI